MSRMFVTMLATVFGLAISPPLASAADKDEMIVALPSKIPDGHVIIGYKTDASGRTNTHAFIKKSGEKEWICWPTAYPVGYVVVEYKTAGLTVTHALIKRSPARKNGSAGQLRTRKSTRLLSTRLLQTGGRSLTH